MTNARDYRSYLASACALAALCAVPSAAFAQAAPEQASAAPEGADIVVTAQKRSERLLDVPVAVSAVDSNALINQNLVQLSDYATRIPGLQYSGDRVVNLSLRGVTTGGAGGNPTVALLIDDVQFGSSSFLGQPPIPDFDPATLERVEVLRGPQGTLYGASSLGGLLKYVTRAPNLAHFSGRAEVGANTVRGGEAGYSARGSVNVPIISDHVGLNVSGFYRRDPSYVDNIGTTPKSFNVYRKDSYGGRAALRIVPTDRLTIDLSAIVQHRSQDNSNAIRTVSDTDLTPLDGDLTLNLSPSTSSGDFRLFTGRVNYELGNVDLTSITAWGRSKSAVDSDLTDTFGGLISLIYPTAPADTKTRLINADLTNKFSEELRLSSSGETIDWLVGLFYTKEHSTIDQTLGTFTSTGEALAVPVFGSGPFDYTEKAAFADLTYHVTPKFDIQVGGRYAANRQNYVSISVIDPPAEFIFGPSGETRINLKKDAFTWLVTPSYHFSDDTMGYIRVASGYRPGGPNNTGLPGIPESFKPDRVVNYELGLKSYAFDRKVSFDAAVFQIDWTDIQLQAAAPNQFAFFANGGKARSRGIEATTRITPWEGFALDANGTYTDAELTEDLPAPAAGFTALVGSDGARLPTVPKFTANISAQQDFPLSDALSGYFGASLNHVGGRLGDFIASNNAAAGRQRIQVPSYTQFDLRAGLSLHDAVRLDVYIRNVFDERGVLFATNRSGSSPTTVTYIQPRTIGFSLSSQF